MSLLLGGFGTSASPSRFWQNHEWVRKRSQGPAVPGRSEPASEKETGNRSRFPQGSDQIKERKKAQRCSGGAGKGQVVHLSSPLARPGSARVCFGLVGFRMEASQENEKRDGRKEE